MALRGHHLSRGGRVGGLQVARKSSELPVKARAKRSVKAGTATAHVLSEIAAHATAFALLVTAAAGCAANLRSSRRSTARSRRR